MSMDTQPASAHATILKAFSRALQREAHVLTQHPDLLWQQMYNRLQWQGQEVKQVLAQELTQRSAQGARPWIRMNTPHHESVTLLRMLEGHTDPVRSCSYSLDGRLIVSACVNGTLRIWDAITGQLVRTWMSIGYTVNSCEFSPDGRKIVWGATLVR